MDEEHFRRLARLTSAFVTTSVVHEDGRIELTWASEGFEKSIGCTVAEWHHTSDWWLVMVAERPEEIRASLARLLSGQCERIETSIRTRAGDVRWLLASCEPVVDPGHGRVSHIHSALIDITERVQLAATARDDQAQARLIIDSALDAVVVMDDGGLIVEWNPQATITFGWTPEEAIGRPLSDTIVPPQHRDAHRRGLERYLATGTEQVLNRRFEITALHRDGHEFPVELTIAPLRREGRITFSGFLRDLSSIKQMELDRRDLEIRMQEAQKLESLGTLAGGVAHDFNNLLGSIMGYADLARQTIPKETPTAAALGHVIDGARRAAELCNQMLAYAGKSRPLPEPVDLSLLVREMSDLLRISIPVDATLRCELEEELPPIQADPAQLRQVVINLILNASDALDQRGGVITVCTRSLPADGGAGEVVLEVSDDGCGMSAETASRIFDPFFTTKFTGRGLGLAAVQGIVRAHLAELTVVSAPGTGSTFTVRFPAAVGRPVLAGLPRGACQPWRGSGTILVVDDDETIAGMVSRMLRTIGFNTVRAASGPEALVQYRSSHQEIVAVLLDLTMPGWDGVETFRRLVEVRADVSVVLSSGYGEHGLSERLHGIVPAAFLPKPYTIEELTTTLRGVLDESPIR